MQSGFYTEDSKLETLAFEKIYQAAKEKDGKKLNSALSIASINVFNGRDADTPTPIAKLAAENDEKSVNFLLNFKPTTSGIVTKTWAIYGHILRGRKAEAYSFIEKLREDERRYEYTLPYVINKIAFALAKSGQKEEAYDLLQRVRRKDYFICDCESPVFMGIVTGLIQGNHKIEANIFLEKEKGKHNEKSIQQLMALSFAAIRQMDEVYEIIKKIKEAYPNVLFISLGTIAYTLGLYGYEEEAFEFFKKIMQDYPTAINSVLSRMSHGFARGGHKTIAYILFESIVNEYPDLIEEVLNKIAYGFSEGGHKGESYSFLERVKRDYPTQVELALREIAHGESSQQESIDEVVLLRTLAMFETEKDQNRLANELKYSIKEYNSLTLLPKLKKLNELKEKQNLTYNQLLGWIQPEIQIFLLQGIALVQQNKLTYRPFFLVVKFLSPMTESEICDLSNKFLAKTCHVRFFKNIQGSLDQEQGKLKKEKDSSKLLSVIKK